MLQLTEEQIAWRLRASRQPGWLTFPDGETHNVLPAGLTCAAVLVPFIWRSGRWELLFTRRTQEVETHKGQVSFPGGACDQDDGHLEITALREANEEIGLQAEDVRILGCMNGLVTISNYHVTPVVGVIPWPYTFRLSTQEVSRVFSIPLEWLAQSSNRKLSDYTPAGSPRSMPVVIYQSYDNEVLWGISAKITVDLLDVLGVK